MVIYSRDMIYRGITCAMAPSDEQSDKMAKHAGVCRLIWNLCLEQRRDWYRQFQLNTGNILNCFSQSLEIKELRASYDFIKECPYEALERVVFDLDTAFKDFFKGGKSYPKFKKKGINQSFYIKARSVRIKQLNDKWALTHIPKIGWVKFRKTRVIEGNFFGATVSFVNDKWQISFGCKIDRDIPEAGGVVGIDRGVAVPIALSDGQSFVMPALLDKIDRQQRKAQRIVSRRKRGSSRHAKAQQRVRNLAARKARIRKDWAHKATTVIAGQYGTVVIERLRTANMTKSAKGTVENPGANVAQKRGLNRAILNVGWSQIELMLSYKAFKLIKINPAYTSQCCSACGVIDKRSRKNQADFQCVECGFEANADHNAAINILQRGNTALLDVEGCGYAPVEASTAVTATAA